MTPFLRRFWPAPTKDYHSLAIIGTQSSGKSTLLNSLFGTQFMTMSNEQERGRTTKGIWMSVSDRVLVLDLEGSDSAAREEDKHNY